MNRSTIRQLSLIIFLLQVKNPILGMIVSQVPTTKKKAQKVSKPLCFECKPETALAHYTNFTCTTCCTKPCVTPFIKCKHHKHNNRYAYTQCLCIPGIPTKCLNIPLWVVGCPIITCNKLINSKRSCYPNCQQLSMGINNCFICYNCIPKTI